MIQCDGKNLAPINITEIEMDHTPADNQNDTIEIDVPPKVLNFAYSFRPVYYLSRVFGLMPFSIEYDLNDRPQLPRVKRLDAMWFAIAICLYLSMAYVSYQKLNLPQDSSVPYILFLGEHLFQILDLVYGALIIGLDMCNRYKLVNILKKLILFDEEVRNLPLFHKLKITQSNIYLLWFYIINQMANLEIDFKYKSDHQHAWLYCSGAMAISLILAATTFFTPEYENYSLILQVYLCFLSILEDCVMFLPSISFVVLLRCLHKRFKGINCLLRYQFFLRHRDSEQF